MIKLQLLKVQLLINLVYGVAADKGEYFDGTPFAKGDILLPTKEANGVLNAQVNPTIN